MSWFIVCFFGFSLLRLNIQSLLLATAFVNAPKVAPTYSAEVKTKRKTKDRAHLLNVRPKRRVTRNTGRCDSQRSRYWAERQQHHLKPWRRHAGRIWDAAVKQKHVCWRGSIFVFLWKVLSWKKFYCEKSAITENSRARSAECLRKFVKFRYSTYTLRRQIRLRRMQKRTDTFYCSMLW